MRYWHWLAVLSVLLTGCAGEREAAPTTRSEVTRQGLVLASNYPLAYFAERIGAPIIEVRLPVPAGVDPAFWKPGPEDVLAMQQADLIVLNGASYESWLPKVSLPTARLVDTTAALAGRLIVEGEATTHSHGPEGEHAHAETAFTTWLDLNMAAEQAKAIADALSARRPEHAGHFATRQARLAQELQTLDAEMKRIITSAPSEPVVFSHPVYQYFARRYGIEGKSVHWEPHEMPSEVGWQELTTLLETHPARWMIWEGEPLPEITAKLAALGIESIVVDPCASPPSDGDFISVMQANLKTLEKVKNEE